MTGLASDGEYLYLSSRSQNRIYRYTLPRLSGRTSILAQASAGKTADIAMDGAGNFWVADTSSEYSLRLYDIEGSAVTAISSETLPSVTGVAVDDTGKLWVSSTDGYIYGIEINI